MTVNYSNEVATAGGIGCFLKLLWKWKGSVYRLLYLDLLLFLAAYYSIHLIYKLALSEHQQVHFEFMVKYCRSYANFFPVSFVLGFFVSKVISRWWSQYLSIPTSTTCAIYVSSFVHGHDEVGRAMRRTIMRYVCVSITMVFKILSPRVQRRFPQVSDLVTAGLFNENERKIICNLQENFPNMNLYFVPIVWASAIVTKARQLGRIRDDFAVKSLIFELTKIRGQLGTLTAYNGISIPLVYTQVVTIAVYSYFVTALFSTQSVDKKAGDIPIDFGYFPVFLALQFTFYMGWLKVAEQLMNPFGDDEDDFDVNSMIDKNLQTAYLIVDDMHNEHPVILKDMYWDEIPTALPDNAAKDVPKKESNNSVLTTIVEEPTISVIPNAQNNSNNKDGDDLSIDPNLIPRHSDNSQECEVNSEEFENLMCSRLQGKLEKQQTRLSHIKEMTLDDISNSSQNDKKNS